MSMSNNQLEGVLKGYRDRLILAHITYNPSANNQTDEPSSNINSNNNSNTHQQEQTVMSNNENCNSSTNSSPSESSDFPDIPFFDFRFTNGSTIPIMQNIDNNDASSVAFGSSRGGIHNNFCSKLRNDPLLQLPSINNDENCNNRMLNQII